MCKIELRPFGKKAHSFLMHYQDGSVRVDDPSYMHTFIVMHHILTNPLAGKWHFQKTKIRRGVHSLEALLVGVQVWFWLDVIVQVYIHPRVRPLYSSS